MMLFKVYLERAFESSIDLNDNCTLILEQPYSSLSFLKHNHSRYYFISLLMH